MNNELQELREKCLSSFLFFVKLFYKLRTGREFVVSEPIGRESHHKILERVFVDILTLKKNRVIINIEPGSGKSELCRHFVAWSLAFFPDSKFIYVSYSHTLATESTSIIRDIISLPHYQKMFNITLDKDSNAKDHFKTVQGGSVYAAGSEGTITGFDAGLQGVDRFSGGLIIDDPHKPDEVFSETTRESVKRNYRQTLVHRLRNPRAFTFGIGQRTYEDDLFGALLEGYDGYKWDGVVLKSIDDAGNVLNPGVHDKEFLDNLERTSEYEFWSQYQQNPLPAGGTVFKPEDFYLADEEPQVLTSFITADTAETDKDYNDATVFSFWGLYKIKDKYAETNTYALHWIDCREIRVEPKHLEAEFMDFYATCCRYPVKPYCAAIEKKSTGATLVSVLDNMRGLKIVSIERTKASGNKATRYLEIQPIVASKLISLPKNAHHTSMCIEHCRKITLNNSHKHDDIADTLYDAAKIALIDKIIINSSYEVVNEHKTRILRVISNKMRNTQRLLREREW